MKDNADTIRKALKHLPRAQKALAALASLEAERDFLGEKISHLAPALADCEAQRDAFAEAGQALVATMTRDIRGRISGFSTLRSFAAAQRLERVLAALAEAATREGEQ